MGDFMVISDVPSESSKPVPIFSISAGESVAKEIEDDSKIAQISKELGELTSTDSDNKFIYPLYDRKKFVTKLSGDEKLELLSLMMKNRETWNGEAIRLITSSHLGEFSEALPQTFIKQALDNLQLGNVNAQRLFDLLYQTKTEKHPLWLLITPYIISLTPEEAAGLKFDGSSSQLLVSLIICLLQKIKTEPSAIAPSTMEKIKILKALPEEIILKLNTAMMTLPEASAAILADLCRMSNINLYEEGHARNSWEPFATSQLERLKMESLGLSPLQSEMEKQWDALKSLKPEDVPADWLKDLASKGWMPFKVLGRTFIYRSESGKYLAVKWQKAGENVQELFKEAATLTVLNKYKKELDLLSQYPEPKGVYHFTGELPEGYFKEAGAKTEAAAGGEAVAYVYEFPNDSYFSYLHDPKEEGDPEIVSRKFAAARHALIADLFTLAKNGLIMTQMADIFHRSEASRDHRDDRGRFMAMNFLVRLYALCDMEGGQFTGVGSGRLHHLETAVKYVNAGYSGLRDVGDSILLSQITQPGFEFTEKYFDKLMKENPQSAQVFILANFLSEYLLVYELTITERMAQYAENQLDWRDPEKVKQLAQELKEGFVEAIRYYSGISRNLASKFINHSSIDWTRASRQLQFFSRKDEQGYLPYNTPESMPKEIYGENVEITIPYDDAGDFWLKDVGMAEKAGDEIRHRGTFSGTDPVKEPERGRVITITHMLLLEKSKNLAEEMRLQADALLKEADIPDNELLGRVIGIYNESLEYWPYDKRVYAKLEEAYKQLGDLKNAAACQRQKAALVIQNSWENYLRKKRHNIV